MVRFKFIPEEKKNQQFWQETKQSKSQGRYESSRKQLAPLLSLLTKLNGCGHLKQQCGCRQDKVLRLIMVLKYEIRVLEHSTINL